MKENNARNNNHSKRMVFDLFANTGKINYYLLYKSLEEEE